MSLKRNGVKNLYAADELLSHDDSLHKFRLSVKCCQQTGGRFLRQLILFFNDNKDNRNNGKNGRNRGCH